MKNLKSNLIVLIGLLGILLSTSCVSTRPANNINTAERRIIKHNDGINNQIERFPSLVNKARVITKEIQVLVPGDSVKLSLLLQDIAKLDSINKRHQVGSNELDNKIDSLTHIFQDSIVSLYDQRIIVKNLLQRVAKLNRENRILFEKYTQNCIVDQTGTYTDDSFIVDYRFINGVLTMDIRSKDQTLNIETESKKFEISIRRHFWQDFKFYIFLFVLLALAYAFPNILQKPIRFIRKLILKI